MDRFLALQMRMDREEEKRNEIAKQAGKQLGGDIHINR